MVKCHDWVEQALDERRNNSAGSRWSAENCLYRQLSYAWKIVSETCILYILNSECYYWNVKMESSITQQ
jgi:hypothetical protein